MRAASCEQTFTCCVFCALKFVISNVDVHKHALNRRCFMKYMHAAIGQHERLSLVREEGDPPDRISEVPDLVCSGTN